MNVQMFTVGKLFTNTYLVSCPQTKEAIIIDPGFDNTLEAEKILNQITEEKLLKYILNTHGHPDHTCGNRIVKKKFQAPILIHEDDAYMLGELGKKMAELLALQDFSPSADTLLHDGDVVTFGKISLKVMHTPGHSRGSMSLIGEREVFTGDTLFMGSIGRTDFPESSYYDMSISLKKLAMLPDNFVVYPGHGPETTIGEEKYSNPFLQ